jgi:hypothetical protein
MKFKALRTKKEPKEFITFQTFGDTTIMFTSNLPDPKPETATMEGLIEYYKKYQPLQDELTMDDIEMVEFEIFEADTVGADIRNKLSPPKNLVNMLEIYFEPHIAHASEERQKLYELIKKEMQQTKESVKYLSELL